MVVLSTALLLAVVLCIAGFVYGRSVPFEKQWPLFEALRNTAAIIFAVVGAWMAIIYPERLRRSFGRPAKSGPERMSSNIRLLLTPAYHSTAILVILLLLGITVPLVKLLPFAQSHVELFRGCSYCLLVALTCWQATIVVLAMYPGEAVQANVDRESAHQETLDARDRLRQVQ